MDRTTDVNLMQGTPIKKRKIASLDKKKARKGYLFTLPFIIGFIVIYFPIVAQSIIYSFTAIERSADGYQLVFVGLENYQNALFVDTSFVQILTAGIQQLILDIPSIVIFSLFIAVLLNQKMIGRAAFRAIFFVPVIIATGLVSEIDVGNSLLTYMTDTESSINTGASNGSTVSEIVSAVDLKFLFSNMKVGTEIVDYVIQLINNIYNIVNRSGVQMLIFLSGLQSISPSIYESCKMDGASGWETFWKITFPMISPMILVNAVYTVIDSFTSESNSVMRYINNVYNTGTVRPREISSAMSWIYFVLVLALIGVVALIASAFVFYQRRD